MLAWCARYAIFATQNKAAVVGIGLPLHGICYDFFFVVSYLYVDRQAPRQLRASAQAMITFITLGLGMFLGNYVGGVVKDWYSSGNAIDWTLVWLFPLWIALGSTVLFVLLFREPPPGEGAPSLAKAMEAIGPAEPPDEIH
jgi:MFS family permease